MATPRKNTTTRKNTTSTGAARGTAKTPNLVVSNLEREEPAPSDPYLVRLQVTDEDGKAKPADVVLGDPADVEFDILISNNPLTILAAAMSDEDFDTFLSSGIKGWQAAQIIKDWREYYGVTSAGEANA